MSAGLIAAAASTAPVLEQQDGDDRLFREALHSPTYTAGRRLGQFTVGVAGYELAGFDDEAAW